MQDDEDPAQFDDASAIDDATSGYQVPPSGPYWPMWLRICSALLLLVIICNLLTWVLRLLVFRS